MKEHLELLYQKLLTDIEECRKKSSTEKEQIECVFKTSINYWEDIKKQLAGYVFEDTQEEIYFYKNIKPKFTSHIEYLTMVYQSLYFSPQETAEAKLSYWQNEEKRLSRFIEKHAAFVAYYKSGCIEMDVQYFIAANYDLAKFTVSKIYNYDGEFMSSHDHVIALLMAHEMYHEYVKAKLAELSEL